MAHDWFRLHETGTGDMDDPYQPDFKGHRGDLDGWAGTKTHPDGAPFWIARVYADESVLDALAADLGGGEQRLPDVPVAALNQMLGQERDADGWRGGFRIGE